MIGLRYWWFSKVVKKFELSYWWFSKVDKKVGLSYWWFLKVVKKVRFVHINLMRSNYWWLLSSGNQITYKFDLVKLLVVFESY